MVWDDAMAPHSRQGLKPHRGWTGLGKLAALLALPVALAIVSECIATVVLAFLLVVPAVVVVGAICLLVEIVLRAVFIILACEPAYLLRAALSLNIPAFQANRMLARSLISEDDSPRAIAQAHMKDDPKYARYVELVWMAECWWFFVNIAATTAGVVLLCLEADANPDGTVSYSMIGTVFAVREAVFSVPSALRLFSTPSVERVREAIVDLNVFYVTVDGVRRGLSEVLEDYVAKDVVREGGVALSRFTGQHLLTGAPIRAALGITQTLGVPEKFVWQGMSEGVDAIVREVCWSLFRAWIKQRLCDVRAWIHGPIRKGLLV